MPQTNIQLSDADRAQITNEAASRGAGDKYDAMDRDALCAALAEYELECDGMSDDEVRAELRTLADVDDAEAEYEARKRIADEAEAARVAEEQRIEQEHPMARQPKAVATGPDFQDLSKAGIEGNCPHCGKSTRSHARGVTEYSELSPGSQRDTTQQFTCNECAGEWGPVVDKPRTARRQSGSSNGLKIEKDRDTQNGVARPSAGGKCRAVWDMLDAIGVDATGKQARAEALTQGFDKTTTMVQFYRWRKFNGVQGRQ